MLLSLIPVRHIHLLTHHIPGTLTGAVYGETDKRDKTQPHGIRILFEKICDKQISKCIYETVSCSFKYYEEVKAHHDIER